MRIQPSTRAEFEAILKSAGEHLVVIDFFATWCGPCKMLSPKFEKMAEEYNKFPMIFVKIDVDENEDLAEKYGITVMPTVVMLRYGEKVDTAEGSNSDTLRSKIELHKNIPVKL